MAACERPVERFLRMAGWSEEHIAEVVAAHDRGETYTVALTFGSPSPAPAPTPTKGSE